MRNAGFLVATLSVLLTGALVTLRLRLPSRLDQLLAWGVLCVGEVVALMLLLGGVGALDAGWIVLASVAVLVVVVVVGFVWGRRQLRDSWAESRLGFAQLGTALQWSTVRAHPLAALVALLAALQVLWCAFAGWALPPTGHDTLTYHLPAIAFWIQRHQITRTPYQLFTNVYPLNTELTFAWPAALLHSDVLVNLGQIPFALLGAAGTAVIARCVGVRRAGSVIAAGLFLLTPVVAQQMAVAYVDLALAGAFLAAFAFVLRAMQALGVLRTGDARPPSVSLAVVDLALAGVAAGIGVGSKESGLAYLGVLGIVAVGGIAAGCARGWIRVPRAAGLVGVMVVPVIVLGSFWYVRNVVDHGNPLWPWNVQVAGVVFEHGPQGDPDITVLRGQAPPSIASDSAPVQLAKSWLSEPQRNYNYDQRLGSFGLLWLLAAIPALIVFTVRCVRRRRDILFLFLVPSAAILLLQPANWWARFTIFFVAAGLVALAAELEQLARWRRPVARVAEVVVAVIVLGTFVLVNHRIVVVGPRAILDHATQSIDSRSAAASLEANGAFDWVNEIPPTATIATREIEAPQRFIYPLFGRHFDREVVNLHGDDPASLRRQLRRHADVRYVLAQAGKPLDRAMQGVPDATLVRRVGTQRIYRIDE